MTKAFFSDRKKIISKESPKGGETESTFDRLLRDYFEPQVVKKSSAAIDREVVRRHQHDSAR